jgi:hypothetical protein
MEASMMARGLAILTVLVFGGCQAAAPAPFSGLPRDTAPALVLPGTALGARGTWPARFGDPEFGRNDGAIALATAPPVASPEWVQVYTSDRLRTSNGRPREYSTTTVRTSRLRIDR